MDAMEQKTERAAFEAWAEKNWMYVDVKDNSWEVWRAAIAAEREARQEAQRRLEALQERINHADKEKAQAVEAERISAANVCLEMAERMERAAGICASNGEADEVSPLRSTAWQLTVAAELIKKGRASIFDAAIRGN